MTNKIIKSLFLIYHLIFYSPIATCRYRPTCSAYAQDALIKHGLVKGSWLTLKRIANCHPFSKRPLYDPV